MKKWMILSSLITLFLSGCTTTKEKEEPIDENVNTVETFTVNVGVIKLGTTYEVFVNTALAIMDYVQYDDVTINTFVLDLDNMPLYNEETICARVDDFMLEHDINLVYSFTGAMTHAYVSICLEDDDIPIISLLSRSYFDENNVYFGPNIYQYGYSYGEYLYNEKGFDNVVVITQDQFRESFYQGFQAYATENGKEIEIVNYTTGDDFDTFVTEESINDYDAVMLSSMDPLGFATLFDGSNAVIPYYSEAFLIANVLDEIEELNVSYLDYMNIYDTDITNNAYLSASSTTGYLPRYRALVYDAVKVVFDIIVQQDTTSADTLKLALNSYDYSTTATHIVSFEENTIFYRSYAEYE